MEVKLGTIKVFGAWQALEAREGNSVLPPIFPAMASWTVISDQSCKLFSNRWTILFDIVALSSRLCVRCHSDAGSSCSDCHVRLQGPLNSCSSATEVQAQVSLLPVGSMQIDCVKRSEE